MHNRMQTILYGLCMCQDEEFAVKNREIRAGRCILLKYRNIVTLVIGKTYLVNDMKLYLFYRVSSSL